MLIIIRLTRFLFLIRFKSLCDCAFPGADEPHSANPIPEQAHVMIDNGMTYCTTTSSALYTSITLLDRLTLRQNGQSSDTKTTRCAYAIGELSTRPAIQINAITHRHWVFDVLALRTQNASQLLCYSHYRIGIFICIQETTNMIDFNKK